MAAMNAIRQITNLCPVSDANFFSVPIALIGMIAVSIFILLIVGSALLCALCDWSTRNEKDLW